MKDSSPIPSSIGRRIIRASVAVSIAHVLFKLASVFQVMVLGHYIDTQSLEIVYVFAFEGCIFSLFLLGEEAIGPSFLPVFMEEMDLRGEDAAWRFANIVLSLQLLLLLVVVSMIMLFPDQVIQVMTEWNRIENPSRHEMARRSVVWLAPALICLSLGSTTYMLLNGYKRFFLAAFGDATWKLCVLFFVLIGTGIFGMDYRSLIFGLLAGSIAKLITHLAGLIRELHFIRPAFRLNHPAVKTMLLLMLPLIIGILFAKVRDIYNNVRILSGLDTEGLMQANSFGRKLGNTISWLIPYSISIAMFPFFCELVDKKDKEQFGKILSRSVRMLLSLFIPFSLVCVALAEPLTFLLFRHGKFGAEVAGWTSISMACYVLAIPAAAVECILMQAFFANRKMISVTFVGIFFSTLSMVISAIGIKGFGLRGVAALVVVALGFVASRILKSVSLVFLLKRSIPFMPFRETLVFLIRALLAGVLCMAVCLAFKAGFNTLISSSMAKPVLVARLAFSGLGGVVAFVVTTKILRLQEPVEMLQWALARLKKRKPAIPGR